MTFALPDEAVQENPKLTHPDATDHKTLKSGNVEAARKPDVTNFAAFEMPDEKSCTVPQAATHYQNSPMREATPQAALQNRQFMRQSNILQGRQSSILHSRQSSVLHSRQSSMLHRTQSRMPQKDSRSTISRKSVIPSTQIQIQEASNLSSVRLGFCDTAAISFIVNLRLLSLKFPRQSTATERSKMAQYVSSLITNFPCDHEKSLMLDAVKAMPPMYSDRRAFTRWVDFFSKRILKAINSPVGINLGNVLVPTEVNGKRV